MQITGASLLVTNASCLVCMRTPAQGGRSMYALLYLAAVPAGRTVVPRQIITTPNAPSSPLYSQGVKAGPHVLVSGIVGIDPDTGSLAGDTIQDQTRQALTNCRAILQAGGASLEDVIEVGVLLTNPADFAGLNEEYARWFPSEPPTRYVAKLGVELPGLLVSIRMAAFVS
jgi:reactive intermediate/imine deaminase